MSGVGVGVVQRTVPWADNIGSSCITRSQAGFWCFMNNKGDTMSVKQYITHRSIFKSESVVKQLPGECAIQKLVEIWWINGIGCSIQRVRSTQVEDKKWRKIFDSNILKAEGEWIRPSLQSFFLLLLLLLFSFYCWGFVSIKINGIYGLEVQPHGLKTKFQKWVLPPWTYDFLIHEIFESIREKE